MAEAVSSQEQEMIDQAIAASKKEWLDAAAEARRARGTSLPVTPAPSPLHGGGVRAAAKHDVVDLCSSSDEEPSVGRSVDGLEPAAAAVPPLLKAGDSVVLAPTASACARREGPLQAGAFGTIVAVDKTNESDDEPYQVLAGDGTSGGRKYWYRATDLLGTTTAAGAGDGVLGAAAAAGAGDGLLKREAIALKRPAPDSADDDDCVVFEPRAEPSRKRPAAAAAASSSVASDDDDVVMEGSTGANALVDFPHARENCVNNRFVAGNFARTCANCFCYVCDAPASACQQWSQHCSATHTEPRWRRERERQKQAMLAPASAPAAPAAAAAAPTAAVSRPAGRRPSPHDDQDLVISCECMMRRVEQVWPVETPAPRGLRSVQLRPYQRQSLAFMLELERAPAGADTIGKAAPFQNDTARWSTGLPVRGGWLTDEVGMGKTMVCLALVLANPLPAARQSAWDIDPKRDFKSEFLSRWSNALNKMITSTRMALTSNPSPALERRYQHNKMQLKTTLILTKTSLLGQWKDEIEKYAPGLTVAMFHSGTSSSERTKICSGKMDLSRVDIVLGTPGTKLPHWLRYCSTFHRVIVDESHEQIGTPPHSSFRWAVTGTPMTTAFSNLVGQARFLGQCGVRAGPELFYSMNYGSYGRRKLVMLEAEQSSNLCHSLGDTMKSYLDVLPKVSDPEYCADPAPVFNALLQRLKKLMIRHTKAQRIRGAAALALPTLACETVLLTLSASEDRELQKARVDDSQRTRYSSAQESGGTGFSVAMTLQSQLLVLSTCRSKLEALVTDINQLRATEPNLHAVVFTQSSKAHTEICQRLVRAGYVVYELSGATDVKKRHEAIRLFQQAERKSKVFVLTMKAGNCGITLSAATRVYLLEPCIDPAHELQAAGRIHRLGQSQDVLCKRFVYRQSYEERVVGLHAQLRAGTQMLTDGRISGASFRYLTAM